VNLRPIKKTSYPRSTSVNEQTQPLPGDFVPLLSQARRCYDAANKLGDSAMAAWYERFYNWLFEQRRRALLAQAAQEKPS
jgi:hypothetical protein